MISSTAFFAFRFSFFRITIIFIDLWSWGKAILCSAPSVRRRFFYYFLSVCNAVLCCAVVELLSGLFGNDHSRPIRTYFDHTSASSFSSWSTHSNRFLLISMAGTPMPYHKLPKVMLIMMNDVHARNSHECGFSMVVAPTATILSVRLDRDARRESCEKAAKSKRWRRNHRS